MLRAFDANGNVIFEQPTAVDMRADARNAGYSPAFQPAQEFMTPEMRFIQASQLYNQRQAEKGIQPLTQQESQMLSYYNNQQPMYYQQQYMHPAQQQSQMFLQDQYNQRIAAGTNSNCMQNGIVNYGISVGNGDEYLKNTTHPPYGIYDARYGGYIQEQRRLIAEKEERRKIQVEVEKKVLKAAYTFLGIEFTDEDIDKKFEPPKPPKLPSVEERMVIENQDKLDRLSEKCNIMQAYDMTEEEYLFMVSPPAVQQRINLKNLKGHLIHKAYKEIHPDDISLVEFLNGPANILYQDSILMDIRNEAQARRLAFDENKYRSYLKMARPTIEISPPESMKGRPSVFDALKVDASWFTPEAEQTKAEIAEFLKKRQSEHTQSYEERKQAFLQAARNGS